MMKLEVSKRFKLTQNLFHHKKGEKGTIIKVHEGMPYPIVFEFDDPIVKGNTFLLEKAELNACFKEIND
jgi:hypothetical protein